MRKCMLSLSVVILAGVFAVCATGCGKEEPKTGVTVDKSKLDSAAKDAKAAADKAAADAKAAASKAGQAVTTSQK